MKILHVEIIGFKEDFSMVFENLGEERAKELYNRFIADGMNKDDAFDKVYAIECDMDEDDED